MRQADFVIAGAMRCGTTSLYRYLGAHPEVFMAPKELGYFTDHFDRGPDWYDAQFATAAPQQVLGEATADYLARDSAMRRIAATLPDVKIVASLRDPVGRAWSHYLLLRERGRETRTFAAAIDAELETIDRRGPESPGVIYTLHGCYDIHLDRAFQLFTPDRVFVGIFERMKSDPARTYAETCRFLGIDTTFVPENLGERVNRYVTFRSIRVRNLAKRLPAPAGRVVARLNTRRSVSNPPMPDADRKRLSDFFAERIERVEELLGAAIPEWRR